MKPPLVAAAVVAAFASGLLTGLKWKEDADAPAGSVAPMAQRPAKAAERVSQAAESPAEKAERMAKEALHDEKEQRDRRLASAAQRAKSLVQDAMQLDDMALRDQAIEKIRQAMAGSDPESVAMGFFAFAGLYELNFDKASFRPVILPHLEDPDDSLRISAWSALMMSGLQPEDMARMREAARTKGMGERTSYYLFQMEKGDLTGESGEIVRGLLDPKDPDKTRSAMQGTWGSRYSPALEADLIALSNQPVTKHDAIYFALSTQQNKSEATVARLLEVLGDPDSGDSGRAAWGLNQGVASEQAPTVAEAALKLISSRSNSYVEQQAWTLLRRYAGPDQLESLKALAEKPNLPEAKRVEVQQIIARIGQSGK